MYQTISLGAYDRFNYGDLLFAHMLDSADDGSIDHVSIAGAKLARVGGHDTPALESVLSVSNPNVILGGGDILTPGWFSVFWQLQPVGFDISFRIAHKLLTRKQLDGMARRRYGVNWTMPFVPPREYAEQARVVYHAVGGAGFADLPRPLLNYAVDSLAAASYVSVRDHQTLRAINGHGIDATLAPDSAAALSLRIEHKGAQSNGLIAVQASDHFTRNHGQQLEAALNKLVSMGYKLVFVPIGLTGGHSDLRAFRRISSAVPELRLHDVSSVQDVMDGIEAADAFIGTSLHGHITATAMAIPNIALPGITKLRAYVETWATDYTPIATDMASIPELLGQVLSQNRDDLIQQALQLGNQAKSNSRSCLKHATT